MMYVGDMNREPWNKFTLHWLSGKDQEIEGYGIEDAVRRAGYGGGALRALDYWEFVPVEPERGN